MILSREFPARIRGQLCKLDPRPLSEIGERLEVIEDHLEELHHQRAGLTRWCKLLQGALDEADDAAAREQAMLKTLDGQSVFAIQGWIPRDAVRQIQRFGEQNHLAVTIEPPSEDDDPPTLLHHGERVAGSEHLVTFYKTPVYPVMAGIIVIGSTIIGSQASSWDVYKVAGYVGICLIILAVWLWFDYKNKARG